MRSSNRYKAEPAIAGWRRFARRARMVSLFTVSMVVTHVICLVLFSAIAGLIADAISQ